MKENDTRTRIKRQSRIGGHGSTRGAISLLARDRPTNPIGKVAIRPYNWKGKSRSSPLNNQKRPARAASLGTGLTIEEIRAISLSYSYGDMDTKLKCKAVDLKSAIDLDLPSARDVSCLSA